MPAMCGRTLNHSPWNLGAKFNFATVCKNFKKTATCFFFFFLLALRGRAHGNKLNHAFSILHLLPKNLTPTTLKGAYRRVAKVWRMGVNTQGFFIFTYVLFVCNCPVQREHNPRVILTVPIRLRFLFSPHLCHHTLTPPIREPLFPFRV